MLRGLQLGLGIGATLVSMTACVVPVGPKWSDPVPGTPPYIGSANPPVGSALGPGQDSDIGPPVQVEVNLADQDTGDVIFLRWIIDYPPTREPREARSKSASPAAAPWCAAGRCSPPTVPTSPLLRRATSSCWRLPPRSL